MFYLSVHDFIPFLSIYLQINTLVNILIKVVVWPLMTHLIWWLCLKRVMWITVCISQSSYADVPLKKYKITPVQWAYCLTHHATANMSAVICLSTVREITKSSSTFSATNINSNIVWLLQLHDTIQMESIFCYQIHVAFISQKEKNVWFFYYHLSTCSVRKMVLICLV